jgi:hypothetical protein
MIDIDGFFHQVAVAFVFAEMRADPTNGEWHGQPLPNELERLDVLALGDEGNISLNVNTGRTGQLTGGNTVTIVLLEEEFEHELTSLLNFLRVGGYHHAFLDFSTAGGLEVWFAFHLNHAEATTFYGFKDFIVAKCGNVNVILPGDLQNGAPCFGLHYVPVDS